MTVALAFSLLLVWLGGKGYSVDQPVRELLEKVDFSETLMRGLLSFLLFAGAIQFRLRDLTQEKYVIALLATLGVAASTGIIGYGLYFGLTFIGMHLPLVSCLIFGALISPTDPIALIEVMKKSKAPKSLEMKIAGESLFNDGMSVVLFVILLGIANGQANTIDADHVITLLLRQIVGGVLFGLILGWLASQLLAPLNDFPVEVMITLATACGGYAAADHLHLSGPITVVTSALVIGNEHRKAPFQKSTRHQLESFWELVNELLNALLFVWIGLTVLVLDFTTIEFNAGLIAIPITLIGRFGSIWFALTSFGLKRGFTARTYWLMTWGGIRGGISVALALSLPKVVEPDSILSITYVVVVFSILVQGLTLGWFVPHSNKQNPLNLK
jgi:CPA1 family monovalent cation:H+ antiporter